MSTREPATAEAVGTLSPASHTHCPSCGRFVGTYPACPACGARVDKRLTVTLFKWSAVGVAVVGLAVLYLVGLRTPVPAARVVDLSATMNFAYVRVTGRVASDLVLPDYGGFRFTVNDGTGDLMVVGYGSMRERIQAAGIDPRAGDDVEVAGSVRLQGDSARLIVQVPEHIKLTPKTPPEVSIGKVSSALVDQPVLVQGEVLRVYSPRPGSQAPYSVVLRDGEALVRLSAFASVFEQVPAAVRAALVPGATVQVRALVDEYRERVQLQLARGSDLTLVKPAPSGGAPAGDAAAPPPRPLAEINAQEVGGTVTVAGVVTAERDFAKGKLFTLQDGTGQIDILLWRPTLEKLPAQAVPAAGWKVNVTGRLDRYRDRLEVIPSEEQVAFWSAEPGQNPPPGAGPAAAAAIELAAEPAADAAGDFIAAPPPRPIDSLQPTEKGERVTVRGQVVQLRDLGKGHVVTVRDATGKLDVVLWQGSVGDFVKRAGLRKGQELTATGLVKVFRGKMQVVPGEDDLGELEVAEGGALAAPKSDAPRAAPAPAPAGGVAIGSLQPAHENQRVTLQGKVASVRDAGGKGYIVTLSDDTGRIPVMFWNAATGDLVAKLGIGPGAGLSVRGKLRLYKDHLELVVDREDVAHVRVTAPAPVPPPAGSPGGPAGTPAAPATPQAPVRTTLGAINDSLLNQMVDVEAVLSTSQAIKGGILYTLEAGGTRMTLVVWESTARHIARPEALQPGVRVGVRAKVTKFRDKLQLTLVRGDHIGIR